MKKNGYKRALAACLVAGMSAFVALSGAAAPLQKDPPAGYAVALPAVDDTANVMSYEDFEKRAGDATGRIGAWDVTHPEDPSVKAPTFEITDEAAHTGNSCLKVSNRGTLNGTPMGYNTLNYDGVAFEISQRFIKDKDNRNKSENYYFTAYVRNVDPTLTQYFYVQLQYGGSGEVWFPNGSYYEVSGEEWTLIGGEIINGQIYYHPFMEDTTGAGVYSARSGLTGWSCIKLVTHDPVVEGQPFTQTNGDFYIDDLVFWRVTDLETLVPTLPEPDGKDYPTPTVQLTPTTGNDVAVTTTTAPTGNAGTTTTSTTAPTAPTDAQPSSMTKGLLIGGGIVLGIAVIGAVLLTVLYKKRAKAQK